MVIFGHLYFQDELTSLNPTEKGSNNNILIDKHLGFIDIYRSSL